MNLDNLWKFIGTIREMKTPWPPFKGEVHWDDQGDENPLAPFSRGKLIWTIGEDLLLVETMLEAGSYSSLITDVDEP